MLQTMKKLWKKLSKSLKVKSQSQIISIMISDGIGIDILVNNIGFADKKRALVKDMPLQQFQDCLQVYLL